MPYCRFIENESVTFNIVVLVAVLAMVLGVPDGVQISIFAILHFKLQFILIRC